MNDILNINKCKLLIVCKELNDYGFDSDGLRLKLLPCEPCDVNVTLKIPILQYILLMDKNSRKNIQ